MLLSRVGGAPGCGDCLLDSNWYPSGSLTSSRLTSASSSAYTHPLGSFFGLAGDFFWLDCWVGWRYWVGILTDRIKGGSELSDQRRGF